MGLHRRNPSRDENEPEIVAALRKMGVSVQPLSAKGVPDLLCGWRGATVLLEVKLPLGPKGGEKDRRLTKDQHDWWTAWNGRRPVVVRSINEAIGEVVAEVGRQRGEG